MFVGNVYSSTARSRNAEDSAREAKMQDIKDKFQSAMSEFDEKENLQLCLALSSKIDGQAVVDKMKQIGKWTNIQKHEIKDVNL